MKQVTHKEFFETLQKDFNLETIYKEVKIKKDDFKKYKWKIAGRASEVMIIDHKGGAYPYMINYHQRNEEKLKDYDFLVFKTVIGLQDLPTNIWEHIDMKIEKVEHNGWVEKESRIIYKNIYF